MNLSSIIPWKKEERQLASRREEGDPFALLQRRMNSLFDDFFGRSSSELWGGFNHAFVPQIDVSETSQEVRISAELPGLDEKDVEVTLTGNMLRIRREEGGAARRERQLLAQRAPLRLLRARGAVA
jgi:HSP20 family protein